MIPAAGSEYRNRTVSFMGPILSEQQSRSGMISKFDQDKKNDMAPLTFFWVGQ